MRDKIQTGKRVADSVEKILEHYKRDIAQKHVMISIDMNPYMLM